MTLPLLRKPSALVPIALAAGALTIPYIFVLTIGPDPAGDEGAAAHTFQLLMVLQIPAVLYFLARWAPQQPKQAMIVLALQVAAFLAAAAPVFILGF
ncbi:MAG TPA: hypothetical protein VN628_10840 [Vicinamibacterales bacterium]|nr:hypothetical protein [Vicinamibacterales bacterium]